jgi:hypothetical protein
MFQTHYPALVGAYFVALVIWWVARRFTSMWPASPSARFEHPMREFLYALLGGVGVVAMGMLWSRGIKLPEDGAFGPLLGAVNQVLIFSPILLVPIFRRQTLDTVWCGGSRIPLRIGAGVLIGAAAIVSYSWLRVGSASGLTILGRIFVYGHLDELVQVLLEDVALAILIVRLTAKIGAAWAAACVGILFALAHIPALLSGGATLSSLGSLVIDSALAVAILFTLTRARDILWFWPLHFMLDLAQFDRIVLLGK